MSSESNTVASDVAEPCSRSNFYTLIDSQNYDKGGQLAFLNAELAKAEAAGEPVWIIAHVAPGDSACSKNWSSAFSQLVRRYKNTVCHYYACNRI